MPVAVSYPGVYIEEVASGVRTIAGVATSIALFAGWAPRGPTNAVTRLTSFADFERRYGGLDSRALLGYAVKHFYDNGGADAYVLRIAADDAETGASALGDLAIEASSPGGWAGDYKVRLTRRGDDATRFRLDVLHAPSNDAVVESFENAATIAELQAACRSKRAFMIVDAPVDETVATMPAALASITGVDARNSAIYFPWVLAADPRQPGSVRAFPPSGFVAGVIARTDASRGVWKAPAGSDASLVGALGLRVTMSDPENGQLNPRGINCLRTLPVYGTVVWGARTLHGDNDRGSEWKYVPVRRLALFLEESLYRGTQWVVFEPNDEPLWSQIRLNVGAFMHNLFRQGAFQGASPRDAYFVRCDATTTTQADIDLGIVNIHVGFAPLKPAEFVVIKLQQIAGELAT